MEVECGKSCVYLLILLYVCLLITIRMVVCLLAKHAANEPGVLSKNLQSVHSKKWSTKLTSPSTMPVARLKTDTVVISDGGRSLGRTAQCLFVVCLFVFISGTMRFSRYGLGASYLATHNHSAIVTRGDPKEQ